MRALLAAIYEALDGLVTVLTPSEPTENVAEAPTRNRAKRKKEE